MKPVSEPARNHQRGTSHASTKCPGPWWNTTAGPQPSPFPGDATATHSSNRCLVTSPTILAHSNKVFSPSSPPILGRPRTWNLATLLHTSVNPPRHRTYGLSPVPSATRLASYIMTSPSSTFTFLCNSAKSAIAAPAEFLTTTSPTAHHSSNIRRTC